MKRLLQELRKEYSRTGIDPASLPDEPIPLMQEWLKKVIDLQLPEPNAMILSTVSSSGRPSSRTVLLKGLDERGLVFYTNYKSRKGKEISRNPYASILFLWLEMERQIRVEGKIEKLKPEESDRYFSERPRPSQLGAWASNQSSEISGREILVNEYSFLEQKYMGKRIPRPDYWGGYRLLPDYFEFWQGRESRLHDRVCYTYDGKGSWQKSRLSP